MHKPLQCGMRPIVSCRLRPAISLRDTRNVLFALAAMLSATLSPAVALAWGPAGHRIVAELAEQHVDRATRDALRSLLATSGAAHLSDIATWADELRNDPAQRALGRATASSHYINFGNSQCRYDATRDCAGGQCVVAAIDRYARILGDRSQSRARRAEALRFVVHFVADVHQPLHAGYRRDRGGNRYQVQLHGRGTNLHAVWDTPVLTHGQPGWHKYARKLDAKALPKVASTPAQWAEESCRATRDDGIYPRGHRIDDRYLERMQPLAQRRIREAAVRLAKLLDRELGSG